MRQHLVSGIAKLKRQLDVVKLHTTEAERATTATAQGAALNDNAKGGIDRFGFMAYAIALACILRGHCFPMCVGLFAR